ncbi:hypothetical protein [Methylibium sp.]|uniref:hypothetical protein n=1 Tax=Methylibium sp. TaxID=2067992 RepID=UPI00286C00BA|nr:hypothetical protein [Methylibium sp.]
MLLFFSVARSPEIGQGERAGEAQNDAKPVKTPAGMITVALPRMSSAFDTAGWLVAA